MIQHLSESANLQTAYLARISPSAIVSVDELALEFADAMDVLWQAIESRQLSESDVKVLEKLNEYLSGISGRQNAKLWTVDGLASSPEWFEVRRLAKECLTQLAA